MPKLKRNVSSAPDRTGFEVYDGPNPRAGLYEGVIKVCKLVKAGTGRLGFNLLVELDDQRDNKDQFTGFPAWTRLWLGDEEALQAREKALYRAITGKKDVEEVDVVYAEDPTDMRGVDVTKIGGKKPIGIRVKVDIKNDPDQEGNTRMVGDAVYPFVADGKSNGKATKVAADEEPEEDDVELDEEDDLLEDEAEPPTQEMVDAAAEGGIKALRALAKEYGITATKKSDILDEFTDLIADQNEDEDEDDDEDEDEEEPDDVDEEEDDEEDEEDEEDDAEAELREELNNLDRAALKKRLKASGSDFSVKKSTSDEEIRDAIVEAELDDEEPDEAPF